GMRRDIMPACEKCNNKWNWKQTLKTTMTLNSAWTCPHCGGIQYQTQKSTTKGTILTMIMLGIMILVQSFLQMFFDIPLVVLLSFIPFLAMIVFMIYPLVIELSSKEEFLF